MQAPVYAGGENLHVQDKDIAGLRGLFICSEHAVMLTLTGPEFRLISKTTAKESPKLR